MSKRLIITYRCEKQITVDTDEDLSKATVECETALDNNGFGNIRVHSIVDFDSMPVEVPSE